MAANAYAASTLAEVAPFRLPQKLTHRVMKNLKKHLVRASVSIVPRGPVGCYRCTNEECLLNLVLQEGKEVLSDSYGLAFKIPVRVTCVDRNVIYVIRCKMCEVQGVGECANPRQRLMSYFVCARDTQMPAGMHDCAIHRHFMQAGHSINDLEITLVDKISPSLLIKKSCIPSVRVRMENRWTRKLGATLNERRRLHHSFPGVYAAGDSQA